MVAPSPRPLAPAGLPEAGHAVASHPLELERCERESDGPPILAGSPSLAMDVAIPGLPAPSDWPQFPSLVVHAPAKPRRSLVDVFAGDFKPVRANHEPVDVDSDLFYGQALIYLSQCEGDEACAAKHPSLRGRRSSFVLRGSFKRRVPFSRLMIGHEFVQGVWNPIAWQRSLILSFMRTVFPHLAIELGKQTKVFAPVVADCKHLAVHKPGQMRGPVSHSVQEETKLLGGWFAQKPRSAGERRRHFRSLDRNVKAAVGGLEGEKEHCFEPGLEYEFEFCQSSLSLVDYKLHVGGPFCVDISRILKGQAAQWLIEEKGAEGNEKGGVVCYFQFWSQKLMRSLLPIGK